MKLKRTKQPVTQIAFAICAPERLRRLTWCYLAKGDQMAYDEKLANRIRKIFAGRQSVSERKMFGGLTFMVRDHMCCGVMNEELVVRVGAVNGQDALKEPHTRKFDVTGRPMSGMVVVAGSGIETDASLRHWVLQAVDFISTLPDKKGGKK